MLFDFFTDISENALDGMTYINICPLKLQL